MKKDLEDKLRVIVDVLMEQSHKSNRYGLFSGKFGIALFLLHYYKYNNSDDNIEKESWNLIEEVFDDVAQCKNPIHTFCNGIAGIGCGLDYAIKNKLINADINEIVDSNIDDYLFKMLKSNLSINNWDYLHGALGIGAYFLMKSQYSDSAIEKLDYLITYLKDTAQEENNNLKWQCIIDHETEEIGYNISLSHGITSIVALMTKMYKKNIFPERTSKLAKGAIEYILKQEMEVEKYGCYFPGYSKGQKNGLNKSRLGWCYGDLGISIVLLNAGRAFKNKEWEKKAIEVLLYAARERKDLNSNMIFDAGLCHGAVSVAHIFYRAWWITQIQEFKDAAKYWYEQVLLMSTFKDGLAGFKSYTIKDDKMDYINEIGLLEGVAGIGLSILSYITNTEPTWDECLLLS